MFQNFSVLSSPETGKDRVARLRGKFDGHGIDAFIIPRADEFQGEYVPASAARLQWLTGFTGSAGACVVTRNEAFIFVDGRYTTQVRIQADMDVFQPMDLVDNPPPEWITANAPAGMRIGYDPWLHTTGEVARLEKAAKSAGAMLVAVSSNPLDAVWDDRPALPVGRVSIQSRDHAGKLAHDKIAEIDAAVTAKKADAFVMTDPSSVAWAFNIRGADVPHTPHPLARAIFQPGQRPQLFIENAKLRIEEKAYLTQLSDLKAPEGFAAALGSLGRSAAKVLVDPALTPKAIATAITEAGGRLVEDSDPARLPRAVKNTVEIAGSQRAHLVDGAAMVTFLAWLDREQPGSLDEITVAKTLEATRSRIGQSHQLPLKDVSFETISGAGPNGAIIHYRVNEQTNRKLQAGELFLLDSGGQYVSGTTDITRTVAIGTPTDEMRRFFTLVLKGMIAISVARFPENTKGSELDPLARIALWKAGADFGHGTGHGVGSYLSVHEGPQSISRRGTQALLPGMILSNEPGYYREGAFGIRIENLIYVHEPRAIEGGDKPMLGFETLTLCPIDRRLVEPTLLTEEEHAWLNAYHARVRHELTPMLESAEDRAWLDAATAPL
ncbi:aminopeptidase P family protein [Georhizobium profundi]|uniref:Aminopeptidase P family protein n=1 Tax=Georhizobium profundi TaxID=2341112 RepID=A0A3Q8XN10_9HYPH|nr:aminopeptidase P family protein [Georhizobium profundi]AZN71287.1 aminopeptidase P family protein [Georhizobium profundi]